ncbi:hypothetical protein SCAR479_13634 [Seiridium cardinale]|uniref:DUF302 domain-containing protein n=1 Tax=Seiridium cardinale TaxID=138064 RepID=A0ABR2X7E1_9PEZI
MSPKDGNGIPHASNRTIQITHVTIPCNRSFEEAKAALERAIPPLDLTFHASSKAGNFQAAHAALKALPTLNNFVLPPRNFGRLLNVLDREGKAVQYEIGNPLTATLMTQHELGVGLYAPVRVLLREDRNGEAFFEFDRPTSTMGQFEDDKVNVVARELDRDLTEVLVIAAGWETYGQWKSKSRL